MVITTVRGAVPRVAPSTVAGVGGMDLAVWATPAAPRTGVLGDGATGGDWAVPRGALSALGPRR
jgi:hypothetical protein